MGISQTMRSLTGSLEKHFPKRPTILARFANTHDAYVVQKEDRDVADYRVLKGVDTTAAALGL